MAKGHSWMPDLHTPGWGKSANFTAGHTESPPVPFGHRRAVTLRHAELLLHLAVQESLSHQILHNLTAFNRLDFHEDLLLIPFPAAAVVREAFHMRRCLQKLCPKIGDGKSNGSYPLGAFLNSL